MSEQWYQNYILLALRIDKAIRKFTSNPFVDAYYGPQELKARVETEAETSALDLLRAASQLTDALPVQGFESRHMSYLGKQILSMETFARRLNGETFSLEEETQRCLDILPERIPETEFDEAIALYDEILPGEGNVAERLQAHKNRLELPQEKAHLLPDLLQRTLQEVRRRTKSFVALPEGEEVDVQIVTDKHYGGACWYLGNYRSRIDINTDIPMGVNMLPYLCSHEVYPGHHTESVSKERHLYIEEGHLDQSIVLLVSPHCVISEGIATLASGMIFAPDEIEQWLTEYMYPVAGILSDNVPLAKLLKAAEVLEGVWGNAAFMLREGRSDAEVMRYFTRYMLISEERVPKYLEFVKVPFQEPYVFTYFYGKRLMQPLLQGPNRLDVFRTFLMEQTTPSQLKGQ